ncbi:hypothetical protein EV421DRAFT_1735291 [Armillaria borealis]|uniref:DUF6593 domain-containing protein n=1 Tax=Armillaria borealis TaxID=47425 RepID=A0AA39JKW9_9AGAR|nr:hypothetical protein EV421DRAFT_1735291 [Armillaria borealis]
MDKNIYLGVYQPVIGTRKQRYSSAIYRQISTSKAAASRARPRSGLYPFCNCNQISYRSPSHYFTLFPHHMPFTPDSTMLIRSREYGDGSEYDLSSTSSTIIPDHYVKRLWRRQTLLIGNGGTGRTFINKDESSSDRSVAYSTTEEGNLLRVLTGGYGEGGSEIARVTWSGSGRSIDKGSMMTIGNKSGAVKDLLKKSNRMSTSRIFVGPDGLEYKWKVISVGNDPAFPETTYKTLYVKDSKHPVATTSRLSRRDGNMNVGICFVLVGYTAHAVVQEEAYPIYIAERGMRIQSWIVASLVILEKIQTS